jgi:hypothetical protein
VGATYPDGTPAPAEEFEVVLRDEAGDPRTATVSGLHHLWFVAAPGRSVDVEVYAWRGRGTEKPVPHAGRATVVAPRAPVLDFRTDGAVVVPLTPFRREPRPEGWRTVSSVALNARSPGAHVHLLTLVDAATGAPAGGRRVEIETGGAASGFTLAADGRLVLEIGPGRRVVRFDAAGFAPLDVVLEPAGPGTTEATVRLAPLP